MAKHKVQFIFGSGGNGWAELWYVDTSTVAAALDKAKLVVPARNSLLGIGCFIEAIRVATVDKPFKSRPISVFLPPASSLPPADTSWNTILGRAFDATGNYKRVVQLRGVRDEWIVRNADGTPKPPADNSVCLSYWNTYMQALKTQAFMFKVRDDVGAMGTEINVTSFGKDGSNRLTAVASGVTGGPGDYVTLSGVTGIGASQFTKGRIKIRSNNGTDLVLESNVGADIVPEGWSPGKIRRYAPAYPIVEDGEMLRYSHRDTGRRFFVTRGRRSKRPPVQSIPAV